VFGILYQDIVGSEQALMQDTDNEQSDNPRETHFDA
jgi:hypothetical protein